MVGALGKVDRLNKKSKQKGVGAMRNIEKQTSAKLEKYILDFNKKSRFLTECVTFAEVVAELERRGNALVQDEFFASYK